METYLLKPWTMSDVEQMALFYKQHMAPQFTQYPWPRDLFEKFVKEHNGSVRLSTSLSLLLDQRGPVRMTGRCALSLPAEQHPQAVSVAPVQCSARRGCELAPIRQCNGPSHGHYPARALSAERDFGAGIFRSSWRPSPRAPSSTCTCPCTR